MRNFITNGTQMVIEIRENETNLGKRYIARQYKDGNLVASYPADELSEIDLSFFEEQP
jgi:hypothetical protein